MKAEKRCPTCNTEVQLTWMTCPLDGTWLSPSPPEEVQPISLAASEAVDQALEVLTRRLQLPGKRTLEQHRPGSKRCPKCKELYPLTANFCSVDSSPLEQIQTEELIGQVLSGSYQVVSLLGEGGSSKVYKAKHVFLGREVAIKILHRNEVNDELKVKRFLQESRAVSSLNHANIVNLYDFGLTEDGRPYLVMDLLEGRSLYELLQSHGTPTVETTIRIFRQVGEALNHAHLKGIVHRDVKPANIVIIEGNIVKLVDFGLAKIMSWANLEALQKTQAGMIFGSPRYMSPEQCSDSPIDIRSDIYSLGVCLFECLTGKAPFSGESVVTTLLKHIHEEPPNVREINPDIEMPDQLEHIVMKCLHKDPNHRYQSMNEIIHEFDEITGLNKKVTVEEVEKVPPVKPKKEHTTVLIVDDEEVTLLAYSNSIRMQPDFEVVGVAINGELAVQQVKDLTPDVVIMDFELPVINGADATRLIKQSFPNTKILILSSHNDRVKVLDAFAAGAEGYALKSLPGERFFTSIRTVAVGSLWIDDGLDDQLIYEAREMVYNRFKNQKVLPVPGTLSHIELRLLKLLLEGCSDEELCKRLELSPDLLQTQKRSIMRVLNSMNADNTIT